MFDLLSLLMDTEWAIRQLCSNTLALLIWSALCFLAGYGSCRTVKVGHVFKLRTVAKLNAKEREVLRKMVEIEGAGSAFSISAGSEYASALATLASLGIIRHTGAREIGRDIAESYTIDLDWRRWLSRHPKRIA